MYQKSWSTPSATHFIYLLNGQGSFFLYSLCVVHSRDLYIYLWSRFHFNFPRFWVEKIYFISFFCAGRFFSSKWLKGNFQPPDARSPSAVCVIHNIFFSLFFFCAQFTETPIFLLLSYSSTLASIRPPPLFWRFSCWSLLVLKVGNNIRIDRIWLCGSLNGGKVLK